MNKYKEVFFDAYCPNCKNHGTPEDEEPCCNCLDEPARVDSHKPVNFEDIDGKHYLAPERWGHEAKDFGYFSKKEKVNDYLYKLEYDTVKEDYNTTDEEMITPGFCSAVAKGNYVGRNFDWTYDDSSEFFIHINPTDTTNEVYGMTGAVKDLNAKFIDSDEHADIYKQLPMRLQDGINQHGLTASVLVIPHDTSRKHYIPNNYITKTVNAINLVSFILFNFKYASQAVASIKDHVEVILPDALIKMEYSLHYMIKDSTSCYCLELYKDGIQVIDISDKPYFTNFPLYGVNFYEDGSVATPEYGNPIKVNNIDPYGSGLERYNYINSSYQDMNDISDMQYLLDGLNFTNAYPTKVNFFTFPEPWYSEFVGGSATLDNFELLEDYRERAGVLYSNRNRNDGGVTWQTVHSVIYNTNARAMYLSTQESGTWMGMNISFK